MSWMPSLGTLLLMGGLLLSSGCGGDASTVPPTPEQAAKAPPLPTPGQENSAGFSAPTPPE